jgi:hypothetical protein
MPPKLCAGPVDALAALMAPYVLVLDVSLFDVAEKGKKVAEQIGVSLCSKAGQGGARDDQLTRCGCRTVQRRRAACPCICR